MNVLVADHLFLSSLAESMATLFDQSVDEPGTTASRVLRIAGELRSMERDLAEQKRIVELYRDDPERLQLMGRVEELNGELARLKADALTHGKAIDTWRQRWEETDARAVEHYDKWQAAESHASDVEQELAGRRATVKRLNRQLADVQTALERETKQHKCDQDYDHNLVMALKKDLKDAHARGDKRVDRIDELVRETECLAEQLDDAHDRLNSERGIMQERITNLELQLDRAMKERDEAQAASQRYAPKYGKAANDLNTANVRLEAQRRVSRNLQATLDHTRALSEARLEAIETAKCTRHRLEERLELAQDEIETLREDLGI